MPMKKRRADCQMNSIRFAMNDNSNPEEQRIAKQKEDKLPTAAWGPYLSERQWGTVREDYSKDGHPWVYFPHDHARSRAYRWGEDGLAGISDSQCQLCFAPAFLEWERLVPERKIIRTRKPRR